MIVIWVLTAASWAGHLGLLLVPSSTIGTLLLEPLPSWILLSLLAALVPQLVIVPWAWIDCGRRPLSRMGRVGWRLGFFFTGFAAVTLYALRYRRPVPIPRSQP